MILLIVVACSPSSFASSRCRIPLFPTCNFRFGYIYSHGPRELFRHPSAHQPYARTSAMALCSIQSASARQDTVRSLIATNPREDCYFRSQMWPCIRATQCQITRLAVRRGKNERQTGGPDHHLRRSLCAPLRLRRLPTGCGSGGSNRGAGLHPLNPEPYTEMISGNAITRQTYASSACRRFLREWRAATIPVIQIRDGVRGLSAYADSTTGPRYCRGDFADTGGSTHKPVQRRQGEPCLRRPDIWLSIPSGRSA